jgi:hypothetical protein
MNSQNQDEVKRGVAEYYQQAKRKASEAYQFGKKNYPEAIEVAGYVAMGVSVFLKGNILLGLPGAAVSFFASRERRKKQKEMKQKIKDLEDRVRTLSGEDNLAETRLKQMESIQGKHIRIYPGGDKEGVLQEYDQKGHIKLVPAGTEGYIESIKYDQKLGYVVVKVIDGTKKQKSWRVTPREIEFIK